jgi:Tfp pilus assembly protein PilV
VTTTRHRHNGAALAELMVSLLLLAVSVVGLLASLVHSQRVSVSARLQVQATNLLQDLTESLTASEVADDMRTAFNQWRERASQELPLGEGNAANAVGGATTSLATLNWRDPLTGAISQTYTPTPGASVTP